MALLAMGALAGLLIAEALTRWLVTVRDVGPAFTIYDPVLGKRLKPNLRAERITPEFTMRISTNARGFRGPELSLTAADQPILFLGDSFTLGYGVNDGEEYPARVAAALRRRYGERAPAVANAGIGNSGNGYWVKFLRAEAPALRPRLIVMQVFANDFDDNVREGMFAIAADGSLVERPVPPPGVMRRVQSVIEAIPAASRSHLVGLLRQALSREVEGGGQAAELAPQVDEVQQRVMLGILDLALRTSTAQGSRTLGVLVGLSPSQETAVAAVFQRHGAPVVVIPSKQKRPDLYYKIDGHWHAAGHAFVAERVLEALEPSVGAAR